jgi:hypothetical protein
VGLKLSESCMQETEKFNQKVLGTSEWRNGGIAESSDASLVNHRFGGSTVICTTCSRTLKAGIDSSIVDLVLPLLLLVVVALLQYYY